MKLQGVAVSVFRYFVRTTVISRQAHFLEIGEENMTNKLRWHSAYSKFTIAHVILHETVLPQRKCFRWTTSISASFVCHQNVNIAKSQCSKPFISELRANELDKHKCSHIRLNLQYFNASSVFIVDYNSK